MSMVFVAAAVILSAATLALLLRPLLRAPRRDAPSRAEFDVRLYRDQLVEVERDAARGLLAPAEAEAARTEVKRRLLAAADAAGGGPAQGAGLPPVHRRWPLALALAVALPAASALLYIELGEPGSPDQPIAERRMREMLAGGTTTEQAASLEQATQQLEKRLEGRPDELGGWFLLGRSYLSLQRFPDAVRALARARALAPEDPDVVGAYAEAALAAAGGQVDATSREALAKLLALDPASPKARFLLALDKAQQGDLAAAMQGWVDLAAISAPDAPWLPMVREYLDQAGAQSGIDPTTLQPSPEALALAAAQREPAPASGGTAGQGAPLVPAAGGAGPNAADVAAAREMSPGDREQMIRGMVDRLAARLQEQPDDIDGWRRLARAWEVLGEPEKAAEARARVAALEQR